MNGFLIWSIAPFENIVISFQLTTQTNWTRIAINHDECGIISFKKLKMKQHSYLLKKSQKFSLGKLCPMKTGTTDLFYILWYKRRKFNELNSTTEHLQILAGCESPDTLLGTKLRSSIYKSSSLQPNFTFLQIYLRAVLSQWKVYRWILTNTSPAWPWKEKQKLYIN